MAEIRIPSKRGDFHCPYLSSGKDTHVVLLFPAIFGPNSHSSAAAARLHRRGYSVVTINYYARSGSIPDTSTHEAIEAAVGALSDQQVLEDTEEVVRALHGRASGAIIRIGTLGFCVGGTYALLAACESVSISAAVSYYGTVRYTNISMNKPVSPMDRIPLMQAPLLAHFGTIDRLISSSDVDDFETTLGRAQKPYELFRYRGAPHAFDEDHRPAVFRAVAAQLAWSRTLTFLDWHLRGLAPR